jgi:hypothetical protein
MLISSELCYAQSMECGFQPIQNLESYSGEFRGLFKPIRTDLDGDEQAPSEAYFPVLIVFVQFLNDADYDWWRTNQEPQFLNSMISGWKKTNSQWWNAYDESNEPLSDYWMEITKGKLHVCGKAYYVQLDSSATYYQAYDSITAERMINEEIWEKLNNPNNGIDWKEYDYWKDSIVNGERKFFYLPDGYIDCIYKIHKSTGNVLWEKDGYSALSAHNCGINYEVDTVNHIFINYGYGFKGSGITVCRNAEKKRILFPAQHEHGHYLYANGHITYGKVAYGPGTEVNFSPYEQMLFGFAKYETANLSSLNTFTIGDYSGRDTNYNQFLIIPINNEESFAIANRGNLSRWDRVMMGDTARIQLTDLNSTHGRGAYIYHFFKQPVFPNGNEIVQDLECADGFWHWNYLGTHNYYAYDRGWCWNGGGNWLLYGKDSVIYDNDNGWNDIISFLGDEKSYWTPIRFSLGKENQDPCIIGLDRIFTNGNEYFSFDPNWGDRWDPWNVGYNEVFSPYSSPSTNTYSNGNSDIFIYLNGRDSVNNIMTFKVYKTGSNGLSLDSILKLTPPSRPMNIKIGITECQNEKVYPVLTWNHNTEPDMCQQNGQYKRYKIFRAWTDIYNVPGDYSELADILVDKNVNPSYIDYGTYAHCPGGSAEVRNWVRYKIKAVDSTNLASVYSDFVSISTYYLSRGGDTENPISINNLPKEYKLFQNYPNPFNPITKINYDLPKDSKVSLVIYDILGREIMRLINGEFKQAGSYIIDFNGSYLASGVYFYRIEAGSYIQVKKMLLIK